MFTALLDTCVLVPSLQRDVLLQCAASGVYRPVWSAAILDELTYTLTRLLSLQGRAGDEVDAYVKRLLDQMARAFPDAAITDWEPLVPTIVVPDPADAHVVAAAIVAGAQIIVTSDQRGFTSGLPAGLDSRSPDEFLLDALDLTPVTVADAVRAVAARSGRHGPPRTARDIAVHLQRSTTPEFGAAVLEHLTGP